jgi:hypothetical protein
MPEKKKYSSDNAHGHQRICFGTVQVHKKKYGRKGFHSQTMLESDAKWHNRCQRRTTQNNEMTQKYRKSWHVTDLTDPGRRVALVTSACGLRRALYAHAPNWPPKSLLGATKTCNNTHEKHISISIYWQ